MTTKVSQTSFLVVRVFIYSLRQRTTIGYLGLYREVVNAVARAPVLVQDTANPMLRTSSCVSFSTSSKSSSNSSTLALAELDFAQTVSTTVQQEPDLCSKNMCGLQWLLAYGRTELEAVAKAQAAAAMLQPSLSRRGPDHHGTHTVTFKSDASSNAEADECQWAAMVFEGFVLHMRGKLTPQPVVSSTSRNVLLWNGEAYSGLGIPLDGNDTEALFDALQHVEGGGGGGDGAVAPGDGNSESRVLEVLSQLRGPWAFVYWQHNQKRLWFGRDYFGRRSLLERTAAAASVDGVTILTSTAAGAPLVQLPADHIGDEGGAAEGGQGWSEVAATGIHCIDMSAITPADAQSGLASQHARLHKWAAPTTSSTPPTPLPPAPLLTPVPPVPTQELALTPALDDASGDGGDHGAGSLPSPICAMNKSVPSNDSNSTVAKSSSVEAQSINRPAVQGSGER